MIPRAAISLLLFLPWGFSLNPSMTAEQAAPGVNETERIVVGELDETGLPGAAIAIVSGDRIVFVRGFGMASVETGIPVTADKPAVVRPMADDSRLWPAGNMCASANDLARFAMAFLNGGEIEGRRVLSPSVIAAVSTQRAEIPSISTPTSYGYGLFLDRYRGLSRNWHDDSISQRKMRCGIN